LEYDVDPLFRNITAKFNEQGAHGLLLNYLPIDNSLDILLESKTNNEKNIQVNEKLIEGISDIINGNEYIIKFVLECFKEISLDELEMFPNLFYFRDKVQENTKEVMLYNNLKNDENKMNVDENKMIVDEETHLKKLSDFNNFINEIDYDENKDMAGQIDIKEEEKEETEEKEKKEEKEEIEEIEEKEETEEIQAKKKRTNVINHFDENDVIISDNTNSDLHKNLNLNKMGVTHPVKLDLFKSKNLVLENKKEVQKKSKRKKNLFDFNPNREVKREEIFYVTHTPKKRKIKKKEDKVIIRTKLNVGYNFYKEIL
jgi:hypothetical protein